MAVKVKYHRGAYWLFINHKGKRKAKRIGKSEKAAKEVAGKIEAKLKLGDFSLLEEEKPQRPFGPAFRAWLDLYARVHCKPSTVAGYEAAFRLYLAPRFADTDVGAISRGDVQRLIADMQAQEKSRSYIKATLAPLSEFLNHLIEDGALDRNVCLRVMRRNRSADGEKKADFLTAEELGLLLHTCQEHYPASYPFIALLAKTGLRLGEAVALQWGDLDFHGRFIDVRRNLVDGHLTTPKSGKGRRVDMSAGLADTLTALYVERKKETLRKGWGAVPPWVFINDAGKPLDTDNFRHRVWPKLLAKAGLRQIRLHDLRHTFASLLIQNGESLVYVKEQLGHHSIRLTVDVYGHLMPAGNKAAVDKLDQVETATIRNPDATTPENVVLPNPLSG
jgi:integrase